MLGFGMPVDTPPPFIGALAPILSQSPGLIRFKVDEVEPVTTPLQMESVLGSMGKVTERRMMMISSDETVLPRTSHPLVDAVYLAFCEHRPLRLTVDDFALVIAQGFAHHINANAEKLRFSLVAHEGKHTLVVRGSLDARGDWEKAIETLSDMVREQASPAATDAIRLDYSTTTKAARIAGEITLLDAFQKFFDYVAIGICGIPYVELAGTPSDWERLLKRVKEIAQFELSWWTVRVVAILKECLESSLGRPNQHFWQCICKPRDAYGGGVISGWLVDLFPYLPNHASRPEIRNKLLKLPRVNWSWNDSYDPNARMKFRVNGIRPAGFPTGLAEAPVTLVDEFTGKDQKIALFGGFLGSTQGKNGLIQTDLGWAIADGTPLDRLLERLKLHQDDDEGAPTGVKGMYGDLPADLVGIVESLRKMTLFSGTEREWRVGEVAEATHILPDGKSKRGGQVFARRVDGRTLMAKTISTPQDPSDEYDDSYQWQVRLGSTTPVPLPDSESKEILSSHLPKWEVREFVPLEQDIIGILEFLLENEGLLPDEVIELPSNP
jgi:hypothetical protein